MLQTFATYGLWFFGIAAIVFAIMKNWFMAGVCALIAFALWNSKVICRVQNAGKDNSTTSHYTACNIDVSLTNFHLVLFC
jgi:hypothetical protein